MDNSIDFKGTGSRLCSIKHFYMLMNNSGLSKKFSNKKGVAFCLQENDILDDFEIIVNITKLDTQIGERYIGVIEKVIQMEESKDKTIFISGQLRVNYIEIEDCIFSSYSSDGVRRIEDVNVEINKGEIKNIQIIGKVGLSLGDVTIGNLHYQEKEINDGGILSITRETCIKNKLVNQATIAIAYGSHEAKLIANCIENYKYMTLNSIQDYEANYDAYYEVNIYNKEQLMLGGTGSYRSIIVNSIVNDENAYIWPPICDVKLTINDFLIVSSIQNNILDSRGNVLIGKIEGPIKMKADFELKNWILTE